MTQSSTTTSRQAGSNGAASRASRGERRAGNDGAAVSVVVAGIHEQGESVRVVLGSREPSGDVRIVEARSFGKDEARAGGVAAYLKISKAERVVRVIPSSRTLCRCVAVPADIGALADRSAAAAALELIGESELSSGLAAHRRAAGVISPGPADAPEAVLCVGWPERAADADDAVIRLGVKDESWAAELVALGALGRHLGGARVMVYADQPSGSVALIMASASVPKDHGGINGAGTAHTAGRTLARVLRGDNSSESAWRASVSRAIGETQRSIGGWMGVGGAISIGSGAQTLTLVGVAEGARRLPNDANWMNQFGLAYGAIIAGTDPDAARAPLSGLRLSAPKKRRGVVAGALEWCTSPMHAAIVIGACGALLLLWPWAVAAGRVAILSNRAGGQDALQQRLADADRRANFYEQLKQRRWPMTKLLADIAGSAPIGVTLETLSITREQGLTIRGKAEDNRKINQFAKNLDESYVFGGVGTPTSENTATGVEFQVQAAVTAPLFTMRRSIDFGGKGKTLYDRMYNTEDAQAVAAAATAEPTASGTATGSGTAPAGTGGSGTTSGSGITPAARPDEAGTRTRRSDSERAEADAAAASRARSRTPSANAIPDPITDEDIAKMDADTAMKEWTSRKNAASKPDLDAAVKQRLKDEAEKCKAQMTAKRAGG